MYSLYDLYIDIIRGSKDQYSYNEQYFTARRKGTGWVITHQESGFTADCPFYFSSMLDFQGVAACLLQYKRPLTFDKAGNIVSSPSSPARSC